MSDEMPSRIQVGLGLAGVMVIALLGFIAFDGPTAADRCRAAMREATTAYKTEQVVRGPACRALRGKDEANASGHQIH